MLFNSPKKLFLFSRYWSFCLDFFSHVTKRLDKKDKGNFKFDDATAWLVNTCLHMLPNILRSKGNENMKFGPLIECNMRNIFLEKSYKNVMEKLVPALF